MPPRALNDSVFTFPFALEDPTFTPFIDTTYYSINATVVRISQDKDGIMQWHYKPLKFSPCSKSKGQMNKTSINEGFLGKLACADYDRSTYINSSYEYGDYNSIQFEFFPCRNGSSSGVVCQPQAEIERVLSNSILLGQYLDFVVIPEDYENPIQWKVGNWFTAVSINSFKQVEVFIKQFELNTDKGLIFNTVGKENYLKVDQIKELYYNNPSTDGLFLRFIYRYSSNKSKISRKYVKLQNVFVELGGFLKFLTFFSIIINYGYSKLKFYEMLSSSLNIESNHRKTPIPKLLDNINSKKELKAFDDEKAMSIVNINKLKTNTAEQIKTITFF
jgi:hypothetical protein